MVSNPFKRNKETTEKFSVKSVLDRLEEEGLKPLLKGDVLEKRINELKTQLKEVAEELAKAKTFDQKGKAVDKAHNLVFYVASAWLRSMENPWLADKVNDFIEQYREFRKPKLPDALGMLVDEAKAIINLAFTNIDVEPLRPIVLQTGPRRIKLGEEVETY